MQLLTSPTGSTIKNNTQKNKQGNPEAKSNISIVKWDW